MTMNRKAKELDWPGRYCLPEAFTLTRMDGLELAGHDLTNGTHMYTTFFYHARAAAY